MSFREFCFYPLSLSWRVMGYTNKLPCSEFTAALGIKSCPRAHVTNACPLSHSPISTHSLVPCYRTKAVSCASEPREQCRAMPSFKYRRLPNKLHTRCTKRILHTQTCTRATETTWNLHTCACVHTCTLLTTKIICVMHENGDVNWDIEDRKVEKVHGGARKVGRVSGHPSTFNFRIH